LLFFFKDRSEKIGRRLTLSNERFKELERRRNMEIEGFKTDIKMLRQKLKYVEKQLFRVSLFTKTKNRFHLVSSGNGWFNR
jgi:coiled-coil domain-containing protein 77